VRLLAVSAVFVLWVVGLSSADQPEPTALGQTLLDRVLEFAEFDGLRVASPDSDCAGIITSVYDPPYDYALPVGHFCHAPGAFNMYIAPEKRTSPSGSTPSSWPE
jgi:hypothetical protein